MQTLKNRLIQQLDGFLNASVNALYILYQIMHYLQHLLVLVADSEHKPDQS